MLQDARQKLEAGYSRRQIPKDLGLTDTALRKRLKSVSVSYGSTVSSHSLVS